MPPRHRALKATEVDSFRPPTELDESQFGAEDEPAPAVAAPPPEVMVVPKPPEKPVRTPYDGPAVFPGVQAPAESVTPLSTMVPNVDARKVCLLLPQYRQTNPLTLYSILANWNRLECGLSMQYGDAFIIHTRNKLATKFVHETKFEWAWFVDDDMVLPMGNAHWFRDVTGWADFPEDLASKKSLDQLLSHGKTFVGGLYFGRNHRGIGLPMFAEGFRDTNISKISRDVKTRSGLRATEWIGTGCLLIHRSVFESVEKNFPHLAPVQKGEAWHYFTPFADFSFECLRRITKAASIEEARRIAEDGLTPSATSNNRSGEDIAFCRRALRSGHQPYVDMELICGHVGSQIWGPQNTRAV